MIKKKPSELRAGDVTRNFTVLADAAVVGDTIEVVVRPHGSHATTTRAWDVTDAQIRIETAEG